MPVPKWGGRAVTPANHPITASDDRLATAEVPGRASPFPDGRGSAGVGHPNHDDHTFEPVPA